MRYHVFHELGPTPQELEKEEEDLETHAQQLLSKFHQMINKYHYLLLMVIQFACLFYYPVVNDVVFNLTGEHKRGSYFRTRDGGTNVCR